MDRKHRAFPSRSLPPFRINSSSSPLANYPQPTVALTRIIYAWPFANCSPLSISFIRRSRAIFRNFSPRGALLLRDGNFTGIRPSTSNTVSNLISPAYAIEPCNFCHEPSNEFAFRFPGDSFVPDINDTGYIFRALFFSLFIHIYTFIKSYVTCIYQYIHIYKIACDLHLRTISETMRATYDFAKNIRWWKPETSAGANSSENIWWRIASNGRKIKDAAKGETVNLLRFNSRRLMEIAN